VVTIPELQIDLTNPSPGVVKTGEVYRLPKPVMASQLNWQPVNGGYAARLQFVSDQAKRMCFHLAFKTKPSAIRFRVQGNSSNSAVFFADQNFINDNNIWLPITVGTTGDLEIFIQGDQPEEGSFEVDAVNIIVAGIRSGNNRKIMEKQSLNDLIKPKSLGLALEPEFDLACWNGVPEYPALQVAANATALISFIRNGGSFICTGTLLNDQRNSSKPWFITANHCVTDQRASNTLSFEWFFQAPACLSSDTDSRYSQTFGGARLLYANKKNDTSFMRLRARPPAGVAYSGWSTKRLFVGRQVWGVHHPEGDHTMVSQGAVTGLNQTVKGNNDTNLAVNEILFSVGGAEIASSGSGLFTVVNGLPYWVGGLYGGPVNDYQLNYYSRFRDVFPKIQPWLGKRRKS